MIVSGLVSMSRHFQINWNSWGTVAIYCFLVCVFLYGLLRPRKQSEWRNAGIAWAWVIALYAEMYGIPLTLYILSAGFAPHLNPDDFQKGHLWAPLLRLESFYWTLLQTVIGNLLIALGGFLAVLGWRHLWRKRDSLAAEGIYAHVRHPQYAGFFLFIIGSLINWPTLPTLVLAPILMWAYYRLARQEESIALQQFDDLYKNYLEKTGMFLPKFRAPITGASSGLL